MLPKGLPPGSTAFFQELSERLVIAGWRQNTLTFGDIYEVLLAAKRKAPKCSSSTIEVSPASSRCNKVRLHDHVKNHTRWQLPRRVLVELMLIKSLQGRDSLLAQLAAGTGLEYRSVSLPPSSTRLVLYAVFLSMPAMKTSNTHKGILASTCQGTLFKLPNGGEAEARRIELRRAALFSK